MNDQTAMALNIMTKTEAQKCVERIKHGWDGIQQAVRELYERQGWRALDYPSWKSCCEQEFGFSRQHGYRLLEAARLNLQITKENREVSPKGDADSVKGFVANECQARELAGLTSAQAQTVIRNILDDDRAVTARAIRQEIERENREAAAKTSKPVGPIEQDKVGQPIQSSYLADWHRAEAVARELVSQLSGVRRALAGGIGDGDKIYGEVSNTILADLGNVLAQVKSIMPHAVCPSCRKRRRHECDLCGQRGFISKFRWDTAVPEETKQMLMGGL